MLREYIREMFCWWLPTEEESAKYKREYKQRCIEELPSVKLELFRLQGLSNNLQNQLLDSMDMSQKKMFMTLKDNHQKQVNLHTKVQHHESLLNEEK